MKVPDATAAIVLLNLYKNYDSEETRTKYLENQGLDLSNLAAYRDIYNRLKLDNFVENGVWQGLSNSVRQVAPMVTEKLLPKYDGNKYTINGNTVVHGISTPGYNGYMHLHGNERKITSFYSDNEFFLINFPSVCLPYTEIVLTFDKPIPQVFAQKYYFDDDLTTSLRETDQLYNNFMLTGGVVKLPSDE